jgi:RimJ/RimL family protein N-acetyltransferase
MFDLQPELTGATLLLRPLRPDDRDRLYELARDPRLWEQHPDRLRWLPDRFAVFFDGALASGGALLALHRETEEVVACSRWYEVDPDTRSCAIGYTVIRYERWGDGTNAALKRLMLDHSFTGAQTVWFHVAVQNHRSCRAVEKLGAICTLEAPRTMAGIEVPYRNYRLDRDVWLARRHD